MTLRLPRKVCKPSSDQGRHQLSINASDLGDLCITGNIDTLTKVKGFASSTTQ
jgi:hypothetical protein